MMSDRDPQAQPGPPLGLDDFDALYRGDYDAVARAAQGASGDDAARFELNRVPWDIGEAQPVAQRLEEDGQDGTPRGSWRP